MQVLNSSVARPWKLEQNTSGQASRQALRASRLWKLEQNNITKKGPFFGPQNVRKSRLFFLAGARCLSAGHHLRLIRGPAGNRTTTGSLSASFLTEPRGHLT